MEARFILTTVLEVAAAAFIIYGLLNEEKLARTEQKVFAALKEKLARFLSCLRFHKISSERA